MRELIFIAAGSASAFAGLVFLPLPTPFGAPLIALGLGMILIGSAVARLWFKRWRSRHRQTSDRLLPYEAYLPTDVRRALDETHPDRLSN